MLEKKIDRIYFCTICKAAFIFHADTEDHERLWGHDRFSSVQLEVERREHYKQ
jgi:hypothetical protein